MATLPQIDWVNEEFDLGVDLAPHAGHSLPGYTVDRLLDQGRTDEARDELERLLLDGLNSGNPKVMDDALFEEIVTKARSGRSVR